MEKRNFRNLKKQKTEEELCDFCRKVANEYANSEFSYARTYFTKKYNITISCYYKVLEYAVINNLVGYATVEKMLTKSIANLKSKAETNGNSSILKYQRLYEKRAKNIIENATKETLKEIATEFANNPEVTKEMLATKYDLTVRIVERLLQRAIIENIIDDKTYEKIKKRSLKVQNQKAKAYFEQLTEKRNSNKGPT